MKNLTQEYNLLAKVGKDAKNQVASQIIAWSKDWDSLRSPQRDMYEVLQKAIFFSPKNKTSNFLLPQVLEQYQTLKSNIWKSNFADYNSMFNCAGKTPADDTNAPKQKLMIQQTLTDMKANKQLYGATDHFLMTGEIIQYVGWKTVKKKVRRKNTIIQGENRKITEIDETEIVSYDGPETIAIDPLNVMYDKDKIHNVEECPIIIRDYVTLSELLDDSIYNTITKSEKDMLTALCTGGTGVRTEQDPLNEEANSDLEILENGLIETYTYWGDIYIDRVLHRNMVVTIAAGSIIARFESNPYLEKPFLICRNMPDPETGRGTSPLAPCLPINEISSAIISLQIQALQFTLEKSWMAPKGAFKQGRNKLKPGDVLEYDPKLCQEMGAPAPTPLEMGNALIGFDFLTFLQAEMESATGVFKYMTGAQDNRARTATETNASVSGMNVRLTTTLMLINMDITIPLVEKIAGLLAVFREGNDFVRTVQEDGNPGYVIVDELTRAGNYHYTYGDSQAIVEMEAKIQKLIQLLSQFADRVDIDWNQLVKYIFNALNIPNSEIYLKKDPIATALAMFPPQLKDQIREQLAAVIPQIVQMMQGQGNAAAQGQGGTGAQENFNSQSNPVGRQTGVPRPNIPQQQPGVYPS